MLTTKRTDSNDPAFHSLVKELNQYLLQQYGALQEFYSQFNKIDNIPNVVIACEGDIPVGCGCFKRFDDQSVEIKRMYVQQTARGKGAGTAILDALAAWASELGYTTLVLEMGNRQPEAAILYKQYGFSITPNYGQYIGMEETSICMKKAIR